MKYSYKTIVTILFFVSSVASCPTLSAQQPDQVSIVDYLKAIKVDYSFENRKQLFLEKWPDKTYAGTAEQNTKLLKKLLDEDAEAETAAESCVGDCNAADEKQHEGKGTSDKGVAKTFTCLSYGIGENIGVLGSYSFSVRMYPSNGKLTDQNLIINFKTAASNLGQVSLSGKVRFFYGDSPDQTVGTMTLQEPWQTTIGQPGVVTRWGKKGSSISFDASKELRAEITLYPVIVTTSGSVPIIPRTKSLTVHDPSN